MRILKLLILIASLCGCVRPIPVGAAVVMVVQVEDCSGTLVSSCSFPSAPTNGDIVIAVLGIPISASCPFLTDSNLAGLSNVNNVTAASTNTLCVEGYVVSGSPTGTYSSFGSSNPRVSLMEISGSVAIASFLKSSMVCLTSTTCTDPALSLHLPTGSLIVCSGSTPGTFSGTAISSTVAGLTLLTATTQPIARTAYLVIGSPASAATCTSTSTTSQSLPVSTLGIMPPNPPQASAGMVGDALFERLVSSWN